MALGSEYNKRGSSRSITEIKKLRSGLHTRWWINNKRGKYRGSPQSDNKKCELKNGMNKLMCLIMAHMTKDDKHAHVSMNKGIKRHGDRAVEALLYEFGQIHKYDTFDPQVMEDIPNDIRKKTLHLITMI